MSNVTKRYVNDYGDCSRYEYRNSKGKLHRLDGPAKEYDDGDCSWYVNGNLHRDDGPAIEFYTINDIAWCLNGECILFEKWCEQTNKTEEEIAFLRLKYNV